MYKRVIIKMSGEALKGSSDLGIEPKWLINTPNKLRKPMS